MEQDMALATIQAQLAQLTAQLPHNAERTTMPSVPTFDVPYGQGYQHPQFTVNEDAWGYQGYDQPSNNMFSNAYNSAWRDHSNYMWGEPQQFQQEGYWQQEEDFYSKPMQYAQSNSGSSINYNQILNELNSLVQGSQNQAKEAQQDGYWQQSEEFYLTPMQPPPHTPQQFQSNSSMSMDSDQILQVLTSLTQDQQNQDKKLDKLMSQMGEIMEFMVQIQEQSELSSSIVENSKEDFEIHDAITLEGDMKDEAVPELSKHSPNMDALLLQAEEEEDDLGNLEEFLLQAPQIPMSSNSGEGVLNSLHSNDIPPNVLFPSRFLIPKQEESEKDIVEALPKVQKDIPILGATKQVLDRVEYFKGLCFPRRTIQENEVVEADQEFIQGAVHETIKPKAVEFDDPGQATTIIVNLAKFKIPEMFKDVVFVIEFVSEKESKPSSPILIFIYTNIFLILMIQAPILEFKPLPNHFKYHLPLKDKFHALEPRGV
ncbi:uncharacterized protein LOC126585518 [Malus sylvestris]|uniref:uncharacterized protein LOC126585518 n=1 Tax=Malus sylvestris TaxID=3752 RepID=UPI0021AC5905|nr:uncharacterized protein LOC126585518 [Malus sylvestris]